MANGNNRSFSEVLLEYLPILMMMPGAGDLFGSVTGGLITTILAGNASQAEFDRFEQQLKESNEQGAQVLRGMVGISEPTYDVREQVTDPATRARIQARIDAGTADPAWVGQFTEMTPGEPMEGSALWRAQELAETGAAAGEEYFEPEAARARFRGAAKWPRMAYRGLPEKVRAGTERVQELYGETAEQLQGGAAAVAAQFTGLRGELEAGGEELMGGYEDILGTARGLVSTLGEQERRDITRTYGEAQTAAEMGLARTGFGPGSPVSASIGSGFERERTEALGRLQDRLTRQRLGVEQTFGMPALGAEERLMGAGINIGAMGAGAAERFVGAGANLGVAQAGALQAGNQLFAGTTLGAAGGAGQLAFGEAGAYDTAAANYLNNLYNYWMIPLQTQMQGAQMQLGYQPWMVQQPQPYQLPTIQGYGGN